MSRLKKAKLNISKPHYRIQLYFKRSYELNFHSELEARRYIQARGLTNKTLHYTELWKMDNEDDGEQIGVWENSNFELVIK